MKARIMVAFGGIAFVLASMIWMKDYSQELTEINALISRILLFGIIAAIIAQVIYFLSKLHEPYTSDAGLNGYSNYLIPGLWIATISIQPDIASSGWFMLDMTFFVTVFILGWTYPTQPRKYQNNQQKLQFWGFPAGIFFVGILLSTNNSTAQIFTSNEEENYLNFAFLLNSIPAALIAVLSVDSQKPNKKQRKFAAKGLTAAQLRQKFTWKYPEIGKAIITQFESFTDYTVLDEILLIRNTFPRAYYRFPEWRQLEIWKLEKSVDELIQLHLSRNQKYSENEAQCWCMRCNTRTTQLHFPPYHVVVCRTCKKDDKLITNAEKVTAVLRNGEQLPRENGDWQFLSWQENNQQFIPADYDEVFLKGDYPMNYDWYVNAMMDWLEVNFAQRKQTIRLIIQRAPALSENANRLIEAAEKEGKIVRVYR